MSEELTNAPEELEPEARRPGSAPDKKPLAEFLAEFEARLRNHPDEPATGAVQEVDDRAAGFRRAPRQVAATAPAAPDVVLDSSATAEIVDVPVEDAHVADPTSAETALPPDAEGGTAEAAGESRRVRVRRRRKHRHRAH
jgi:hypothetical protein